MTTRGSGREAAARALDIVGRVQVFGLASAAAVAERYVGTVDRYLAQRVLPGDHPRTDAASEGHQAAADGPAAQAAARMEQALLRTLDLVSTRLPGQVLPPAGSRQEDRVELPPAAPGGVSTASLWVHNPTAAPVSVLVRVGSLTAADGHVLPAGAVTVAPAVATGVGPGGCAEIRLHVRVPAGTPAGHFHALVTSTATPRQALSVHLEVLEPQDRG